MKCHLGQLKKIAQKTTKVKINQNDLEWGETKF